MTRARERRTRTAVDWVRAGVSPEAGAAVRTSSLPKPNPCRQKTPRGSWKMRGPQFFVVAWFESPGNGGHDVWIVLPLDEPIPYRPTGRRP